MSAPTKRPAPGWLFRSMQEARVWIAEPKNRRFYEQWRSNLLPNTKEPSS